MEEKNRHKSLRSQHNYSSLLLDFDNLSFIISQSSSSIHFFEVLALKIDAKTYNFFQL
jgi:hypothetical protein